MICRCRSDASRRAVFCASVVSFCFSVGGLGTGIGPTAPTVYVNPRAGADDPRVGLKGGLYDAGVAASGMQLGVTKPEPGSFAPDLAPIAAAKSTPVPPPPDPHAPRGTRPPPPTPAASH